MEIRSGMYQVETDKDGSTIINSGVTPKELHERHGCSHDLYKAGAWIKCRKCTAEWFDPDNKFNLLCKKKSKKKSSKP